MVAGKQSRSSQRSSSAAYFSIVALLAMWSVPVCTLAEEQRLSQYPHRAWLARDGFFNGTPWAITRTIDGYIWIGTDAGLFRFDGSRFEPWSSPDGTRLPSDQIRALLGARDGSLWIRIVEVLRTSPIANWFSIPIFMTTWVACSTTSLARSGSRPVKWRRPRGCVELSRSGNRG